MMQLDRRTALKAAMTTMMMMCHAADGRAAGHAEWTPPVEVRHEENLCLTYRAMVDGSFLIVQATIEPGWHTFAMDNKQRAEEKLAGRKSLGIDHSTEIRVTGGLEVAGPWYQSPPKDFSKPELRWFSWGFEKKALFATKILRPGSAAAQVAVQGQACTDTICKNIDVIIPLPPVTNLVGGPREINLKEMVGVK